MAFEDGIPRRLTELLAVVWRAAHDAAVAEGLGDFPSGPPAEGEDEELCAAAASMVDGSGMQGSYPSLWGGRMHHWTASSARREHERRMEHWREHRHDPGSIYWDDHDTPPVLHLPTLRWSAPRRAALAVFYEGLRLGLSPTGACRAVSAARHAVRVAAGLDGTRIGLAKAGRMSRTERVLAVAHARLPRPRAWRTGDDAE